MLSLLALLLLLGSPELVLADKWPFGSSGGFGARGGDYYNLGILGAKAKAAEDADPGLKPDVGPSALEIVLLFPDGPAAKAGLQVGDVLVGIGRKAFKEGSLAPLAEALTKAEGGSKKGILKLLVERDGAKTTLEIDVGGDKHMGKPLKGKARKQIVEDALEFLASKQQGGGFAQTLSGQNGAVVQTAMAGLAWMVDGSTPREGKYRKNLKEAVEFVIKHMGSEGTRGMGGMPSPRGGANWDQTNWGLAHAAVFLGTVQARKPSKAVKEALAQAAKDLCARQESSGGWAHGPGGKNALNYLELNIVTGLALWGLGMAQKAGIEIPDEVLEKANTYLEKSGSGDGGVAYADANGQRGQGNIGRTAGAWLGYRALGRAKSGWGAKMGKFIGRHADGIMHGHASLMQHIFLGGLAAHAAGGATKKKYWGTLERDMVLARSPDGSFQPRPWHESLQMRSNSDVTFGQIWTTAAWALVVGCEPGDGLDGIPEALSLK